MPTRDVYLQLCCHYHYHHYCRSLGCTILGFFLVGPLGLGALVLVGIWLGQDLPNPLASAVAAVAS